jgi:hypothetical protein
MFLFSQDLLLVCYGLLLVWVLTTALIAVHRPMRHCVTAAPLRLAGGMLLQALPLMLVLFFLFPRIGPLWSVPLKSHTAQTGMSDRLRPGDVSSSASPTRWPSACSSTGEIRPGRSCTGEAWS